MARSRFCPSCGRALPQPAPELAVPAPGQVEVEAESLDLQALVNVVESGVRHWQQQLASGDTVTRAQAASAIEELSKILLSLSQQLAQGRTTMRITTRMPVLRAYDMACPACGGGNRRGAKFCQRCGAPMSSAPSEEPTMVPILPLTFAIAAQSDIGQIRRNNQDAIFTGTIALPDGSQAQLCLVADGMGGAAAGERASQIAAEALQHELATSLGRRRPPDDAGWESLLRAAAILANRRIYNESRQNAAQRGMGTTLTVVLIVGERIHIASVGDSRAYLINARGVTVDNAKVAQLTSDHSLVARLVDIGQITAEEARTHPQRNLLYRSLGTDPTVDVDTRSEPIEAGDVVLICSDGLFSYVRDEELARIAIEQADPGAACAQLIALANQRGGSDNISVVIIRAER
ncbi:Stp1/IreP family PP2C-type Ser/Thr phosphatase [Chloroflexia bacterium SDU3-3]|nr:Stp1/IreP family PP2C-type Ser/Thr phosphatase [Chloroflexia bacterium SDU3-3]